MLEQYDENYYDLVHSRCVGPGIKKNRWPRYVRELAKLAKRGGWVQLAEFDYNIQSDSGRLTDDHNIYKWGRLYRAVMETDRDPRVCRRLGSMLRDARLTNIESCTFQVPIGDWPTGRNINLAS